MSIVIFREMKEKLFSGCLLTSCNNKSATPVGVFAKSEQVTDLKNEPARDAGIDHQGLIVIGQPIDAGKEAKETVGGTLTQPL